MPRVSPLVLLGIGLVGGLGALARFALDGAVSARLGRAFPYGTLAVNVAGALALGVVAGAALSGDAERIVAAGALGGFTTFSTWMLEAHRLTEDGRGRLAAASFAVSLALGIAAVWLGRTVGSAL